MMVEHEEESPKGQSFMRGKVPYGSASWDRPSPNCTAQGNHKVQAATKDLIDVTRHDGRTRVTACIPHEYNMYKDSYKGNCNHVRLTVVQYSWQYSWLLDYATLTNHIPVTIAWITHA